MCEYSRRDAVEARNNLRASLADLLSCRRERLPADAAGVFRDAFYNLYGWSGGGGELPTASEVCEHLRHCLNYLPASVWRSALGSRLWEVRDDAQALGVVTSQFSYSELLDLVV